MATVSGATLFALSAHLLRDRRVRPGRDPTWILVLNDLGWIVFVAPVGMALVQNLTLAWGITTTTGPVPCTRGG